MMKSILRVLDVKHRNDAEPSTRRTGDNFALWKERISKIRSKLPSSSTNRTPAPPKECIICYDSDVKFSPEPLTSRCSHSPDACISCIAESIRIQIIDHNNPSNIRCPSTNCDQVFEYEDVRRGLGNDSTTFTRYDEILIIKLLQRDEGYVTCLNASCGAGQVHTTHGTDNYPIVTCYKCSAKTCYKHRVEWHEGYSCEEWDNRERIVTKEDILSTEWVAAKAKRCPECNNALEKKEGCNHFTCAPPGGCGHEFCWECLAPYVLVGRRRTAEHKPPCVG